MKKRFHLILLCVIAICFLSAPSLVLAELKSNSRPYQKAIDRLKSTLENSLQKQQTESSKPDSSSNDFLFASNGSEIQINSYQGNGGHVTIPSKIDGLPVTRIAPNAFKNADAITSIILPECLQYVGDYAFRGLQNLTGVLVLPQSVIEIGHQAFRSTGITGLVIQSDCKLDSYAFADNRSLDFLYVKDGYSPEIGVSVFEYSESLKTAILPSSLRKIKDDAFKSCNFLVIYTPEHSYASEYANKSFILHNTVQYENYVNTYDHLYCKQSDSNSTQTKETLSPQPTALSQNLTGFSNASSNSVSQYIYVTPEPTALPTPTPIPTSEPTPIIEYIYITPEPTNVPFSASIPFTSYDELLALRQEIEFQIEEFERQYAIENGNRIITLDCEAVSLFPKQTRTLTAEVRRVIDTAPETTAFMWSSSDEAVATISDKGIITAVSAGEATITCTAADDEFIFASIPVFVGPRVSSITVSDEKLTLHLNETNSAASVHQLQAAIAPNNALCQDVVWSSSDEKIAMVDENGIVHALSPGTVTIRVTSSEVPAKDQKAKSGSCSVTVIRDVASIELDQTNLRLKKTGTATLKAVILPENATTKKVTWESSDTSIATITSAGQITAKACGTCIITCKATDGSNVLAECELTVFQPVTSLKPVQSSLKAFLGAAPTQAEVIVSPSDATEKDLNWISRNPFIAVVDADGKITAVSGGSCTIVCTSRDGTNKVAEFSILVPSISVNKTDFIVTKKSGLTIPFKYFGQDISKLTMSIPNRSFFSAKLNTHGEPSIVITPEKAGKTTITLNDGSNPQNAIKLNIEVANSAVYNSTSYPKASYSSILRYPEEHEGTNKQIYGRVVQTGTLGNTTWLRVATRGYEDVFFVTYSSNTMDARVIENDYVTIYGKCTGTYSYQTVLGAELTIPSIKAEKIKIGRK